MLGSLEPLLAVTAHGGGIVEKPAEEDTTEVSLGEESCLLLLPAAFFLRF